MNRSHFIKNTLLGTIAISPKLKLLIALAIDDDPDNADRWLASIVYAQSQPGMQKEFDTDLLISELYHIALINPGTMTEQEREEAIKRAGEIVEQTRYSHPETYDKLSKLFEDNHPDILKSYEKNKEGIDKTLQSLSITSAAIPVAGPVIAASLGLGAVFSDDFAAAADMHYRTYYYVPSSADKLKALSHILYYTALSQADANKDYKQVLITPILQHNTNVPLKKDASLDKPKLKPPLKEVVEKSGSGDTAQLTSLVNTMVTAYQQKLEEAERIAERERRVREMNYYKAELEGAMDIGFFLMAKLTGDPGLANDLRQSFGAVMSAFEAISKFKAGDIGSIALSANLLDSGMKIASLMQNKPDATQLILQQTKQINRKLDALKELVENRFNRLEQYCSQIINEIKKVYNEINLTKKIALSGFQQIHDDYKLLISIVTEQDVMNKEIQLKLVVDNIASLKKTFPQLTAPSELFTYKTYLNHINGYITTTVRLRSYTGFIELDAIKKYPSRLIDQIRSKSTCIDSFGLAFNIIRHLNLPLPQNVQEHDVTVNPIAWANGMQLLLIARVLYHHNNDPEFTDMLQKLWGQAAQIKAFFAHINSKEFIQELRNRYLGFETALKKPKSELAQWLSREMESYTKAKFSVSVKNYGLYGLFEGVLQEKSLNGANVYAISEPGNIFSLTEAGWKFEDDPLSFCISKGFISLEKIADYDDPQFKKFESSGIFRVRINKGRYSGTIIGNEKEGLVENRFRFVSGESFKRYYTNFSKDTVISITQFPGIEIKPAVTIRKGYVGTIDFLNFIIGQIIELTIAPSFGKDFLPLFEEKLKIPGQPDLVAFESKNGSIKLLTSIIFWSQKKEKTSSDLRNIPLLASREDILDYVRKYFSPQFTINPSEIKDYETLFKSITDAGSPTLQRIKSLLPGPVLSQMNDNSVQDKSGALQAVLAVMNSLITTEDLLVTSENWKEFAFSDEEKRVLKNYNGNEQNKNLINRVALQRAFDNQITAINLKVLFKDFDLNVNDMANPWGASFNNDLESVVNSANDFFDDLTKSLTTTQHAPAEIDNAVSGLEGFLKWKKINYERKFAPVTPSAVAIVDLNARFLEFFQIVKKQAESRFKFIRDEKAKPLTYSNQIEVYSSLLKMPVFFKDQHDNPKYLEGTVTRHLEVYPGYWINGSKVFWYRLVPVTFLNVINYKFQCKSATKAEVLDQAKIIIDAFKSFLPSAWTTETNDIGITDFFEVKDFFSRGPLGGFNVAELIHPNNLMIQVIPHHEESKADPVQRIKLIFGDDPLPADKTLQVFIDLFKYYCHPFLNTSPGEIAIRFIIKTKNDFQHPNSIPE